MQKKFFVSDLYTASLYTFFTASSHFEESSYPEFNYIFLFDDIKKSMIIFIFYSLIL